jgi:hypothetical protein
MGGLRCVKITFSDGDELITSMAAHLTDEEIRKYFYPGIVFNTGAVNDKLVTVTHIEIIK